MLAGGSGDYVLDLQALGPQGFWKLDETAGVVAADSGAFNRPGTYLNGPFFSNPTLVNGIARSTQFDGSSQEMDVPANVAFGPGTAFTMLVWIKGSGLELNRAIMGRGTTDADQYGLFFNGGGGLWAVISHAGVYEIADGNVIANDNERHFIVLRWTQNGTLDLYVDGVIVATLASTVALANPAAAALQVGGWGFALNPSFYAGYLNSAAFFNYALTDGQINQLWSDGL